MFPLISDFLVDVIVKIIQSVAIRVVSSNLVSHQLVLMLLWEGAL